MAIESNKEISIVTYLKDSLDKLKASLFKLEVDSFNSSEEIENGYIRSNDKYDYFNNIEIIEDVFL